MVTQYKAIHRCKAHWYDIEESEEQYFLNELTGLIWVFDSMRFWRSYEFKMMNVVL